MRIPIHNISPFAYGQIWFPNGKSQNIDKEMLCSMSSNWQIFSPILWEDEIDMEMYDFINLFFQ